MIIKTEIERMYSDLLDFHDRLTRLEQNVEQKTEGLPEVAEQEVLDLIRSGLARMGMTQKELADRVGYTAPSMSLALRGKRRMPFGVVLSCLEIVGYRLVAVPVGLPFTPPPENA